ncbi:phage major capsid protein [Streptomyces sp. NPDC050388]|uniref:phage major capsid family protein n=1 Tax=Streptomyces sp. NPDC050388 TaxID=3155781 RepID=UPI0034312646
MTTFTAANLSTALAAREAATDELRKLTARANGRSLTTAERARESVLVETIRHHDSIAREAIENGASIQSQAEAGLTFRTSTGATNSRDLLDATLFGRELRNIAPDSHEGDEFANVTLAAASNGSKLLGKVNVFPFAGSKGMVPVSPRATAQLTAPAGALADGNVPVTVAPFDVVKVTAYTTIDRDELQDYSFADPAIQTALASAVGQRIDHVLAIGGTDGVTTVEGFTGAGTATAANTAGTIEIGDVRNAVARVEDEGGNANALIMSPLGKAAFLTAYADRIGGLPEIIAVGKLGDGTAALDGFSFIAADLTTVGVAMRKDIEVSYVFEEPSLHALDRVALLATARVGGVSLANPGTVQVVNGSAA